MQKQAFEVNQNDFGTMFRMWIKHVFKLSKFPSLYKGFNRTSKNGEWKHPFSNHVSKQFGA